MGAFILVVGGFLLKVMSDRRRPLSPEAARGLEDQGAKILAGEVQRLIPFGADAFTHMGADWRGTYRRFGTFTATGHCPVASDVDRAVFLTRLDLRGGQGALVARTSQHDIRMAIGSGGAAVTVNGEPLGRVPLGAGPLQDASGAEIGRADRNPGTQIYVGGLEVGSPHRAYSVFLGQRQVAVLHTAGSLTGFDLIDGRPPPLVPWLSPGLTHREMLFVLALCVVEVGYHVPHRTLYRARSRRHG